MYRKVEGFDHTMFEVASHDLCVLTNFLEVHSSIACCYVCIRSANSSQAPVNSNTSSNSNRFGFPYSPKIYAFLNIFNIELPTYCSYKVVHRVLGVPRRLLSYIGAFRYQKVTLQTAVPPQILHPRLIRVNCKSIKGHSQKGSIVRYVSR